ncbi:Fic family protein [Virgibacillus sp. NKC19-16]|uniref:Fic family protein n=1 Tax=Virgibacillus salidurans TaxID=2831673 RepID=UPI001F3F48DE|nr:Fic family protein [Virgibacillus sp. NKC19-16]UJL46662.1 Fic family protein [Virgibacillus sp. NKC19-16]
MKLPQEYIDDFFVRMSHHSSAIENNTISLPETVSIILHNTVPNKVSLRELYEIDNHRYAMAFLLDPDTLEREFTMDILLETHSLLMNRLHHERGKFKTEVNDVKGAEFETTKPSETSLTMEQWVDNISYRMALTNIKEDIIPLVCESHIEFERIHPFADGNGRVGRLIMNYLLLKNDLAPLIIEKEEKERYIFFLSTQDAEGFSRYAEKKIEKEMKRICSFRGK